jgi:hypothetical protein
VPFPSYGDIPDSFVVRMLADERICERSADRL